MEVYRRMGARWRYTAATLPRHFRYPQDDRQSRRSNGLDTRKHRKQTTFQNTHFLQRFGRNDFKEISRREVAASVKYLLKYIEKSGERLSYGGKLPTYFISDLVDEDIICGYGEEERKVILKDDFKCFDEGLFMGKVSPEVIEKMPKAN